MSKLEEEILLDVCNNLLDEIKGYKKDKLKKVDEKENNLCVHLDSIRMYDKNKLNHTEIVKREIPMSGINKIFYDRLQNIRDNVAPTVKSE